MRVKSEEYMIDRFAVYIEPNPDQYSDLPVSWAVADQHGIQSEGLAVSADSAEQQAIEAINQLKQGA